MDYNGGFSRYWANGMFLPIKPTLTLFILYFPCPEISLGSYVLNELQVSLDHIVYQLLHDLPTQI